MFDDLLESTSEKKKTNKGWGFVLSGVVQALILAILILIPLIYTEALPKAMLSTMLVAPPPPPPPPPPPAPTQVVHVKPQVHLMQNNQLVQPRVIPKETKIIKEEAEAPDAIGMTGGVPGGVAGGSMGGVLGGVIGGAGGAPPPPKPTQTRIRQGGAVTAASLINRVQPVYPPLARQTRVAGT